jgi:hypothetical protein
VGLLVDAAALELPMPRPLALATAAVLAAAACAFRPGVASIGAGGLAGHLMEGALAALLPGDPEVVRLGSVAGGVMLGAFAAVAVPGLVPLTVGALLVMLGCWGGLLSTGKWPGLAGLSAAWWALFGVTWVVGAGLQSGREERRARAEERKAEKQAAADARRKEQEMRERYARYME